MMTEESIPLKDGRFEYILLNILLFIFILGVCYIFTMSISSILEITNAWPLPLVVSCVLASLLYPTKHSIAIYRWNF